MELSILGQMAIGGIVGALVGAAWGAWFGGAKGALYGAIGVGIAGLTAPLLPVLAPVLGYLAFGTATISLIAGFGLPIWIGATRNWNVNKTNNPKNVGIVVGDLGTMKTEFVASGCTPEGLGDAISKAGHHVEISYNPNEDEFIRLCNKNELVIVLAHGAGDTRSAMDYYDSKGRLFAGFNLGGTMLHRDDRDIRVGNANGPRLDGTIGNEWITANELDGRIRNPNLVVAAASCQSAKTDRMARAMNSRHYVGGKVNINGATARIIIQYAVEYLNSDHNTAVQIVSGNNYIAVY